MRPSTRKKPNRTPKIGVVVAVDLAHINILETPGRSPPHECPAMPQEKRESKALATRHVQCRKIPRQHPRAVGTVGIEKKKKTFPSTFPSSSNSQTKNETQQTLVRKAERSAKQDNATTPPRRKLMGRTQGRRTSFCQDANLSHRMLRAHFLPGAFNSVHSQKGLDTETT